MPKIINFINQFCSRTHTPPMILVILGGVAVTLFAKMVCSWEFINTLNPKFSFWLPPFSLIVYIFSLIYIPKGKDDKVNVCLTLVMFNTENHKHIQSDIINPLRRKLSHINVISLRLPARFFYSCVMSLNDSSKFKNIYIKYFYRRTRSKLIVDGYTSCSLENNQQIFNHYLSFIHPEGKQNKLSNCHITTFSTTVKSFTSIERIIELYIKLLETIFVSPPTIQALTIINRTLDDIEIIAKSTDFDQGNGILTPILSSTIEKLIIFAQQCNPPNYSEKTELWKICKYFSTLEINLTGTLARFYDEFLYESHSVEMLKDVAKTQLKQKCLSGNNDITTHKIKLSYCNLIIGNWQSTKKILKEIQLNPQNKEKVRSFISKISTNHPAELVDMFSSLVNLYYDSSKKSIKSVKHSLKKAKKNTSNELSQIAKQILDQI